MCIKSKGLRAFTLLESLVALIVISGAVLLFQGMTHYVNQQITFIADSREEDWLLFAQQLRDEFSEAQLDKVEGGRIYLRKSGQSLAIGLSSAGDIRKTNANGRGYQPMLFHVTDFQVLEQNKEIELVIKQDGGKERRFLYAFP